MSGDRNASRGWCAASIAVVGTLAAIGVAATPGNARACSCPHPKPFPRDAMRSADAVFEGRVFTLVPVGPNIRYGFEVSRYWKGQLGDRVEVETAMQAAACGRQFDLGRSYVVYAVRDNRRLVDNLCTRTRPSTSASADLAALGPGQRPAGRAPPEPAAPEEPGEPPREPPRIEPAPPPTAPSSRGCRLGAGPVPAWLLVLPWLGARRRSKRRHARAA